MEDRRLSRPTGRGRPASILLSLVKLSGRWYHLYQ